MEYTAIFRFISFLFVGKGDCVTIIDTQGMHDTENRTCVFTREIASMVKSLKGESQNFHERIARTSPNNWNLSVNLYLYMNRKSLNSTFHRN